MAINRPSETARKVTSLVGRGAVQSGDQLRSAPLTALNFKVPQEFHRDFKTFAAQHSKKMVEVLQEAFALLKEANGR
jgi:hypothetical protein